MNFRVVTPTPKTTSNGVETKYEYCDREHGMKAMNVEMEKVRTYDHESPKRAGLSSRVPLDALQTVVVPEMIEEERKELTTRSTSA